MAWTVPKTWVASAALTAAELNTYIRDNFLETATSKATVAKSYFIGNGPNQVVQRTPQWDFVSAQEGTSLNYYSNLATEGPQVTVTTGTTAIVFLSAQCKENSLNISTRMSVEVGGASQIEATDNYALCVMNDNTGSDQYWTTVVPFGGLTPGSNIFTAKYRGGVETPGSAGAFWQVRHMIVMPF